MVGRNVGVAMDFSACSKVALRWALANMVRPGDRLVLVHVNPSYQIESGIVHLWEQDGSPIIPLYEFSDPLVAKRYGVSPDMETLNILAQAAQQKQLEVVAKVYWGNPMKKICQGIERIPLHCLIVGSRGLSKVKRALLGSVSSFVVNHATCPVTVAKESAV